MTKMDVVGLRGETVGMSGVKENRWETVEVMTFRPGVEIGDLKFPAYIICQISNKKGIRYE